jgi:SAM-dependent methyltransferase
LLHSGDDDLPFPAAIDARSSHTAPPARHDLACIETRTMRGLEVGPLASPRVRKDEGSVLYVDHENAEGLRQKYAADPDMKDRLAEIVNVDYVVRSGQGIYETVARDVPFDYVIASHLIEHIPDPISWLQDVAKTLRDGGILSLVIPDKRYCFDINRRTTEIADLVDAHLRQLHRPSYRQVYDFISKEISGQVDTSSVWAGTAHYAGVVRSDVEDPDVAALQLCRTIEETDEFVDVHCSVFTPDSFLDLYGTLVRLDLIDFDLAYFAPTEVNTLEFFVSLRRVERSADPRSTRQRQLASLRAVRPPGAADNPPSAETPASPGPMEVSSLERRLIVTKRTIIERLRASVRGLLPHGP